MLRHLLTVLTIAALGHGALAKADDPPERLKLLFLGDNGHHRPADRAAQLIPVMRERGIDIQYTDDVNSLASEMLNQFDGLIVYANTERISPEQESALIGYVESGHGFIPLHCASYCFLNSDAYVNLVGAQFSRHGTGVFRTEIADPDHPIMRGFGGFSSWDETYIHRRHNTENRTILEYRAEGDQADGNEREPWTWVRTQGKGRVFYTAWGHDERTWGNPGFQNLVERGIRWACGDDPGRVPDYHEREPFVAPEMTKIPADLPAFEYIDVGPKIPNYVNSRQWGTQGAPLTQMQRPLPPEESQKHYVTPVGFELRLFASEVATEPSESSPVYAGLGGKPIAMNWDERGRLWVCESYDYPNELQRSGRGRDRIRICEDTDGDGQADRFTVFAEELSIPTAITFAYGGAIVQNGTQTLFLKDTDGDDVADMRETLITGWALGDTHGGVSHFQYGLDNWYYAMQGYNQSTPAINGQRQQGFRMGFWRFRLDPPKTPDGPPIVADIEFLRSTDNNTWGLGISEEGIIFGSTANRNPSVYMPIPNRYYERVRGWAPQQLRTIADTYLFDPITDKVRQVDQHGGYTAGAGHALYTAREYPQEYWNRTAFVCGPTGHLVGTFVLEPDGADFHSHSPCNLVASDDEWAAPIMAEVGPDGNVWIVDWYNYIVQHNPTPNGFTTGRGNAYESDLRDKKHGRVYRLVYTNASDGNNGAAYPDLANASPADLVAALQSPTYLVRLHAERLLAERGQKDVTSALIPLVQDDSVDEIGLNVGAIHALWTLAALDAPQSVQAATNALQHPSAGVRRNALQLLARSGGFPSDHSQALGVLNDRDAQVRLAAILALADSETNDAEAGSEIAGLLADSSVLSDHWLADALTSAAAMHALPFIEALGDGADVSGDREQELLAIVGEHVARSRPSSEDVNRLVAAIVKTSPTVSAAVIEGLSRGWPNDHEVALTDESQQALTSLVKQIPAGGQGRLIRLATLWGSRALEKYASEIVDRLLATATDDQAAADQRLQAAREIVRFQPDNAAIVQRLLELVTPQLDPELAAGIIGALSDSRAENVGEELVETSPTMMPAARQAAVRVLLARPETTKTLLDAIEDGSLQLADLSLDQRQALSNHPDRDLRRRAKELFERGGALPNPDRQVVLESLLPLTERTGDPVAGKAVFLKQCSKCHTHSGEGTAIGPDLTGMAVHPKSELLTNIIDPSRSVEANFRTYTVLTTDGLVFNGMLATESRTSIELVDTEAKRHQLQREDIEELQGSRKSLMPEGFEKQITEDETVNLLEFLTHRGKYLPIPIDKAATAVSTQGMFVYRDADVERLIFPDWKPKEFNGVPFVLVDPRGDRVPNAIVLYGPQGTFPPQMPRSVSLPCNAPAKSIHFLSGVGGWAYPYSREETVSMIVRLHYADGKTEDHELKNGVEFADYIRRVDVPGSELAFMLRGQQIRYFAIEPERGETIESIELVKGPDRTAPVVMAVTVETR